MSESKPENDTNNRFESLPRAKSKDYSSSSEVPACIDSPPDSFWVPKDDEKDWLDRNAIVQRSSSRKLSFSRCQSHHFHQENLIPHRSSLSFNHTSCNKGPFIGLPVAVGHKKAVFPGGHHRQSKAALNNSAYFIRSRSERGSKLATQVTEPASPQVNCLGRVGTKNEKGCKKTGLWRSIATVLKTGFKSHSSSNPVSNNCNYNSVENNERTGPVEDKLQQPSLAGLMRLTSGRHSSGIIEPKDEGKSMNPGR